MTLSQNCRFQQKRVNPKDFNLVAEKSLQKISEKAASYLLTIPIIVCYLEFCFVDFLLNLEG